MIEYSYDECPKCGCNELHRDSVDVGVGVMFGPYGCPFCGWSESPEYDRSEGQNPIQEDGSVTDQYGGLWPKDSFVAKAMRLSEGLEEPKIKKGKTDDKGNL